VDADDRAVLVETAADDRELGGQVADVGKDGRRHHLDDAGVGELLA